MSEQTYQRMNAFEASGGEWTLEARVAQTMSGSTTVLWWECSLKFKSIRVAEIQGANPDSACFLAFDTLHAALPTGAIKW